MKKNELAGYINKILHSWENDWSHSKTSIERDLFNYCKELVRKLINEEEINDEIISIDRDLSKIKELENIHPDIYSHIEKLYND
jgi:hypothetical protein